jgi:hypothetical protein
VLHHERKFSNESQFSPFALSMVEE